MTASRADRILLDAFGRVHESLHQVLDGLSDAQVAWVPHPRANTIAWLAWHLARVEDDHLAGVRAAVAGHSEQVWLADGWADRFALPIGRSEIGYGQAVEVAQSIVAPVDLLTGYYDAVHARTTEIVRGLFDTDYDRIVDRRWNPPVTVGVRLVSVVNDITAHVGQAAYVRGMLPPG